MSKIKPEVVHQRIESFAKRFGKKHLYLASHAAFPLALTPDLLYGLWANFQQDIHGEVLGIPWIAVADLLLSSLCDEVGYELYEMDLAVRNQLLKELQADERFGKQRINEMSDFLLEYVHQKLQSHDPDIQDFAKTQQWIALAYTRSSQAARELALAFSKLDQQESAELLRMASLTETFAEPLAEFQPLLIYARGMGKFARGNLEAAKAEFGKVLKERKQIRIAGVSLPVPEQIKANFQALGLKTFSFETVTVDARGNMTNRHNREAKYFVEDLGNGITLEMVQIPGGTFTMGSPVWEAGRSNSERPQHQVTVTGFFMGRLEVTQVQYEAIMGQNPSNFKGKNRPVESVSWNDAMEFCQRLSQKVGCTYRLPSEAEWEYACRAGTTTPFHFGETITTDLANYNGNQTYADAPKGEYRQQTTPVGNFLPNSFGLYDMHGNIWEWCLDTWHENYKEAPSDGSAWIGSYKDNRSLTEEERGIFYEKLNTSDYNIFRVLRGGSWDFIPVYCRSACRNYIGPDDDHSDTVGFRLVCGIARRGL
ncbi:formylglycine-generating enzyme family protein [Mastigocoleus sp. MO_188.B34]|uniref:formylglycine-generating enzyme family protein n=1 Tax=Mastigocoleus sp. MO_188.B34 TaxID=3036635 RepID=UPI0026121A47|nr:formylglycine-generating enzyme family protein [Mastigocoleus sp. MO_188.B34]MDJ0696076.1 formylglycine-generating enzyme family protein [Mastigocoleus sp. MO_188.B34]